MEVAQQTQVPWDIGILGCRSAIAMAALSAFAGLRNENGMALRASRRWPGPVQERSRDQRGRAEREPNFALHQTRNPAHAIEVLESMIPRSGYRFSEKIMLHQQRARLERDDDSKKSHHALELDDEASARLATLEIHQVE
ncbi:MAG: hypothetical protein ACJ8EA_10590 [Xanthobacteraceae bacterium]